MATKKMIAAFDGLRFSRDSMEMAVTLATGEDFHLVGVFLEDRTYSSFNIYDVIRSKGDADRQLRLMEEKDRKARDEAVLIFREYCMEKGVNFSLHRDRSIALRELIHESVYADLLLISARETMSPNPEKPPTRFIRDLLGRVQCPVLLLNDHFRPIDRLLLLFDGEPASVQAIKQFSYLLSTMKALPVEVLSVRPVDRNLHLPDNRVMKEFMKRHFPRASYTIRKGLPEEEIPALLKEFKGSPLVVMGAYQRSDVSRIFRPSMADTLMKNNRAPLFLVHNR